MSAENGERKVKVTEFVEFILKHMTAEEALLKLMASQLKHYEKLKLEKQPEDNPEIVSPYFIIVAAAMDLGWGIAVEENHNVVRGLTVGTPDYIDTIFDIKKKNNDSSDAGGQTGEDTTGNS